MLYSKKLLRLFGEEKNFGKIKNPDGMGKVGNIRCGDEMWLYLKIEKNKQGKNFVKDVKIQTFGCVAAIATSSVVADLARGKTIDQALKITATDVMKTTGQLPKVKIHCSLLATDALVEAIYNYLEKNNYKISNDMEQKHQQIIKKNKLLKKKFGIKDN